MKGIKTSLSIKNKTQRQQIKTSVWGKDKNKPKMSRKKIIKSPSLQLPSTAFLSKGTRRFPQNPAPLRRRVQLRGLSPPGVKEGLGGQEAIIRPLLALRRHLPRPVLISVPKYMGSYVSYFIVEIQALHIKFGHIY